MVIRILGPGCKKCELTEKHVRKAVEELGLEAEIKKIQDVTEIGEMGIMQTPAVTVDGEVIVQGRVATKKELKKKLLEQ